MSWLQPRKRRDEVLSYVCLHTQAVYRVESQFTAFSSDLSSARPQRHSLQVNKLTQAQIHREKAANTHVAFIYAAREPSGKT